MLLDDLYLMGDEDCGVGVNCKFCDRGGLPVIYYSFPEDKTYSATDVVIVNSITGFISAMKKHVATHNTPPVS